MIDGARASTASIRLVREVAARSLDFRPCAVSPKGAGGLMRLMPYEAQLDVRDPSIRKRASLAGAKLLKQLLDRYHGDLALALSAYNAGSGRVDRTFSIPEIPETKDYVSDILGRLRK
jgi:soluble lytic murein transglycosylase-like protein